MVNDTTPEIPQSSKFSRFISISPKVLIEFTEFSYSVLNIFVIIVQDFKPAISEVKDQVMLQRFIGFPELTEFPFF